jgi:hypothetical protein
MSEMKKNGSGDDVFLSELENAVRLVLKNRKSKPSDKLAAINAGVRLAAIKHKISNGDPEEGFFK